MLHFPERHAWHGVLMMVRMQVEPILVPGPRGEPDCSGCRAVSRPLVQRPGVLCLLVLAALVAGCASDEERTANATFGESVRHTIALQTANPRSPGTGLDGVKSEAALQAYRKEVGKYSEVKQESTITVQ